MGIDRLITAIVLASVAAIIIYGGIYRIAKTADLIIPITAIGCIPIKLIVIVMYIGDVRPLFDPDKFPDLDIDRTAWTDKYE